MTEDEAKTKTCHRTFAAVASADGSAPWFSPAACIGSACMAWRIHFASMVMEDHPELGLIFRHVFDGAPHGYCGLAGKP